MPMLKLYPGKSLEENAGIYYDKAKKLKAKAEGAKKALEESLKKLEAARANEKEFVKKSNVRVLHKREWYEKFRWFVSSEGFLVIGGRDASTNDILIKKFTEKGDLVFHTDMAGSPFFFFCSGNKEIGDATKQETSDATVSYSKAWKLGINSTEVFFVEPEQVSKKAPSGEYIKKGAFMIYGKKEYVGNKVNLAIGINSEGKIIGGPVNAVKTSCEKYAIIEQGGKGTSDVAKQIQKKIGGQLDDIIRAMPAGGCRIAEF